MLKNKSGITLIALIITIIVLLILAGITIALVIGDNGILQKSQTAKLNIEIEHEKELIGLAYSAVKSKKLARGDTSAITGVELDAQLQEDNVDARAVGDKPIVVTFAQSGRRYEVDGGGNVTGIGGNAVTSGIEGLTLRYQLGDNIYVYPQADGYDKEYYEALEEYYIKSETYWLIDGGYIPTGTVLNSFAEVMHESYQAGRAYEEYSTLQEYFASEGQYYYSNCADWLLNWEWLGYVDYMENPGSYSDYYAYAEEIYNQLQELLPDTYYITMTFNGETERIDLATTNYAEFTKPDVSGNYPIYGVDEQNNSEANISAYVVPLTTHILSKNSTYTIYYDNNMTWREFVESPFGHGYGIECFSFGDIPYNEYVVRYTNGVNGRFNIVSAFASDIINDGGYGLTYKTVLDFSGLSEFDGRRWESFWDEEDFSDFKTYWNLNRDENNRIYFMGNGIGPFYLCQDALGLPLVRFSDCYYSSNSYVISWGGSQ